MWKINWGTELAWEGGISEKQNRVGVKIGFKKVCYFFGEKKKTLAHERETS
jgi:hypothetical protein